jgi:hypothetical protein
MTENLEALYEQHIKPLSGVDQLRLIERIAAGVVRQEEAAQKEPRNIMELHGKGAKVWNGVNADQYVEELRGEWDHRP